MNALIFDLDNVSIGNLKTLFYRFDKEPTGWRTMPLPTYISLSGNGVHIYYVFEEPVDLYPDIKRQMKSLKDNITYYLWDWKGTTLEKTIQYQSINQGFRMVGSINANYGVEVKAFRIGGRVTLDYINRYARDPKCRVDVNKKFPPSKMTKEDASKLYPEWHCRVFEQKELPRIKKWGKHKGHKGDEIYNWWLSKIDHAKGGHRYYFMMMMAVYARKSDPAVVPYSRLEKDMQEAFEILRNTEHGNELTQEDVNAALRAYDKNYYNFALNDIEKLTNIRVERNKRNGRKQAAHIEVMNAMKAVKKQLGEVANEGRPSALETVAEYRFYNPDAKKADCIRETGLSKPTVYKWWDERVDHSDIV
jgi:hypothetical protein